MLRKYFVLLLLLFTPSVHASTREELIKQESLAVLKESEKIAAQFYTLAPGEEIKEITDAILQSSDTNATLKEKITATKRRFFLFTYPSDGLLIKGYLSFVPESTHNPLMILLRGGNRMLGLMHPATDLSCPRNYTVLATAYRGGVSEGNDEFGGDDVNDVANLMRYFPTLQQKLGTIFTPKKTYMLGGSRGGMQMFLALARFPELQQQIDKAASLSGLLNLQECMQNRPDMKAMFIRDFGLIPGQNDEAWTTLRCPTHACSAIRRDLPIAILQGTSDIRVNLQEGKTMAQTLKAQGYPVTYIEIEGATHCLSNIPNRIDIIADWFEQ